MILEGAAAISGQVLYELGLEGGLIVSKGFVPCLLISCSTCTVQFLDELLAKYFLRENEGYLDYLLKESLRKNDINI